MIDSELEMLKGRVDALERAAQKPAIEPDADDRTEKIYQIIKDATGHAFGLIEGNHLRIGIRKAMNEFYRGPDAAAITLKKQLDKVEADLRFVIQERDAIKRERDKLWNQLQVVRDILDGEEPNDEELAMALRRQEE